MANKKGQAADMRRLPILYVITSFFGILASFILTHDKIKVLANPDYVPACNISPILSCGSVMTTEQASLFGVPNSIFGLVAFAALFTFGFLLIGGATVKKWVWQGAQVAATLGVIFMHYLFFQGVYRINAICPWCFVIWMITIPIFWYTTVYNLRAGNLPVPARLKRVADFAVRNHGNIITVWYGVIFIILLTRFWYYWSSLL